MNVKPEDFVGAIISSIAEYTRDVREEIDNITEEVAKETKNVVKEKEGSFKDRRPKYRKSLSVKIEKQTLGNKKATIYAKAPHYRLTHLLEHGHATVNGGRTRAFPHWKPAEDYAIKEYEKRIADAIENGGK